MDEIVTATDVATPLSGFVDTVRMSLESLWDGILGFLYPNFLGGVAVILIGWLIAVVFSKVAAKVVEFIRLDDLVASTGIRSFFQKAGVKLNMVRVFEEIVKWFFLIVFFISAADIFGLPQVTEFLNSVLYYIPNIIIAIVITIAGVLVANFVADIAHSTAKAAKATSANVAYAGTRYAVIIFTVLAALRQLGLGETLIDSFVNNLGLALAAAFGLAFGLGGKDAASDVIKKVRKDMM
jgi:hypothetical protein